MANTITSSMAALAVCLLMIAVLMHAHRVILCGGKAASIEHFLDLFRMARKNPVNRLGVALAAAAMLCVVLVCEALIQWPNTELLRAFKGFGLLDWFLASLLFIPIDRKLYSWSRNQETSIESVNRMSLYVSLKVLLLCAYLSLSFDLGTTKLMAMSGEQLNTWTMRLQAIPVGIIIIIALGLEALFLRRAEQSADLFGVFYRGLVFACYLFHLIVASKIIIPWQHPPAILLSSAVLGIATLFSAHLCEFFSTDEAFRVVWKRLFPGLVVAMILNVFIRTFL